MSKLDDNERRKIRQAVATAVAKAVPDINIWEYIELDLHVPSDEVIGEVAVAQVELAGILKKFGGMP
jgi:hypothetical protein